MKKIVFLLSILMLSNIVLSQVNENIDSYKNNYGYIIKIPPYSTFWGSVPVTGEYGLAVEYKYGLKSSIELRAAYVGKGLIYMSMEEDLSSSTDPRLTMNGFRVQADYRFYINKKNIAKGFFAAPYFSFTSVDFSDEFNKPLGNTLKAIHTEFGILSGFNFIFGRFCLEPSFGLKYRIRHWVENYNQQVTILTDAEIADIYTINTPFIPFVGFSLGRTF